MCGAWGKSETRLIFEPKTFKGGQSLECVAIDWKKILKCILECGQEF